MVAMTKYNGKPIKFRFILENKGVKRVIDGNNHTHLLSSEQYYAYSRDGTSVGVGSKGFEEFFMNEEDIEFTNEKR